MASTARSAQTDPLDGERDLLRRVRSLGARPPKRDHLRGPSFRRVLKRLPLYGAAALAAGALALVLAASIPRLLGYNAFIIYGGSMSPALRPGDVALTKPVAAEDVQVGDIIATRAKPEATPVLHRVVAVEAEGGERRFVIKGDSNSTADPEPVLASGSGDRVEFRVPLAGYVIHFVRTFPGRLLTLLLPGLVLGGILIWEIWRPRRRGDAPAPVVALAQPGAQAQAAAALASTAAGNAPQPLRCPAPASVGPPVRPRSVPALPWQIWHPRQGQAALAPAPVLAAPRTQAEPSPAPLPAAEEAATIPRRPHIPSPFRAPVEPLSVPAVPWEIWRLRRREVTLSRVWAFASLRAEVAVTARQVPTTVEAATAPRRAKAASRAPARPRSAPAAAGRMAKKTRSSPKRAGGGRATSGRKQDGQRRAA